MSSLFRIKPINHDKKNSHLSRDLSAFDLTLLGIGAIIGAGVFVLTGVAAATQAGPAVSLSYILAGLAALFAALSYAELATSVGGSGSAYNYAYSSFGELFAWIIGWALILEYTMSISTVAVGWSGYVINGLQSLNISFPEYLSNDPSRGGLINLPAVLIIGILMLLLCAKVKQGARFNAIIVLIKLIVIGIFIIVAMGNINVKNWQNYFPYGYIGIAHGAALVFFAYIGFDALSTAAEETIHPAHDIPRGIIISLVICTIIYVIVATLLTGIANYTTLDVPSPVSDALLQIGHPITAGIIALGAIAGLTSVMLVMFYGLTRILYAIACDGLIPLFFSKVNPATKTPIPSIIISGTVISIVAGFVPLRDISELVNIGTLTAFTFVCAGVIMLRWKQPNLRRPFKLPWNPLIPVSGIIFCIYLMINLSYVTWNRFIIWMVFGLLFYFFYSRQHSFLNNTKDPS